MGQEKFMKKYILSFLVIGTFGLYAVFHHITAPNIQTVTAENGQLVSNKLNQEVSSGSIFSSDIESKDDIEEGGDFDGKNSSVSQPAATKSIAQTTGTSNPSQYKDGTYTGKSITFFYGKFQVAAVISGGKITDIKFLNYPQDRSTSIQINTEAIPTLKSEAIASQSASVNIISGATDSTVAFGQSLDSALAQAK